MNKKLLQSLILFSFIAASSNAQPITFGIKGGLDFTKLTGQTFGGNYAVSFDAGAYATSKFNAKWGWQTEVVYNQGTENINIGQFDEVYTPSQVNQQVNNSATIGAITIPFLFTYKLNNFFSLHAGPQISFNAYTNQNMFENGAVPFKETDFWGVIGGNLDLGGLNFYLRYNNGFTNINKIGGDNWRNRQINFGIEIPIYTIHKKK
jgi:hypothetical protein